MRKILGTAVLMTLLMTVLTGLLYPLALTGVAQVAFHGQANGSLIKDAGGQVVGSGLIGQRFSDAKGNPLPRYFQPRPSAAGPKGYDAMASGGSNLGPTNPALLEAVAQALASYRRFNHLSSATQVPVDAVTSSGSGLDPEISVANARLQAPRVASARGIPLGEVLASVSAATQGRVLGLLGETGVNVLELNLALDRLDR